MERVELPLADCGSETASQLKGAALLKMLAWIQNGSNLASFSDMKLKCLPIARVAKFDMSAVILIK